MKLFCYFLLILSPSLGAQDLPSLEEIRQVRDRDQEIRDGQGCPLAGCEVGPYLIVADRAPKAKKGNSLKTFVLIEGKKNRGKFTLNAGPDGTIIRLYPILHNKELIIAYELDFGGEGSAKVEALELKNRRSVWSLDVPGFNLGTPLHRGEAIYVNAIGFVGKIDLKKRKFAWKHGDLYPKHQFNGAARTSLRDGKVSFFGDGKLIEVDDATGKLLGLPGPVGKTSP
jgi:hypothetical protein